MCRRRRRLPLPDAPRAPVVARPPQPTMPLIPPTPLPFTPSPRRAQAAAGQQCPGQRPGQCLLRWRQRLGLRGRTGGLGQGVGLWSWKGRDGSWHALSGHESVGACLSWPAMHLLALPKLSIGSIRPRGMPMPAHARSCPPMPTHAELAANGAPLHCPPIIHNLPPLAFLPTLAGNRFRQRHRIRQGCGSGDLQRRHTGRRE